MPFIPAVSPSELIWKWRAGLVSLSLVEPWRSNPSLAAYTALVASVTAVPIGWLLVDRLGGAFDRLRFVTAALASAFLVVLLECLQVFIETRVFAADDALWSAAGALIGAMAGAWLIHRISVTGPILTPLTWTPILTMVFFLFCMFYLAVSWAPFDIVTSKAELLSRLDAFRSSQASVFSGDDLFRASNLLRSLLWSMPLGFLAGLAAQHSRPAIRRAAWVMATTLRRTGVCDGGGGAIAISSARAEHAGSRSSIDRLHREFDSRPLVRRSGQITFQSA